MGDYQQLIRGEPFGGKYRKGFEKTVPFEPGKPDRIQFRLPHVAHTFRAGDPSCVAKPAILSFLAEARGNSVLLDVIHGQQAVFGAKQADAEKWRDWQPKVACSKRGKRADRGRRDADGP